MPSLPPGLDALLRDALDEDLGPAGDVTSGAVVPEGTPCRAAAVARAAGVVAGVPVFERVFGLVDARTGVEARVDEGGEVEAGAVVAELEGDARAVLAAERVALNFLTHLSGVATLTHAFVRACRGTGSVVLCTRKTLPGLRGLQRYAVEVGGGRLHRAGLSDGVLVKRNHLRLAGGVAQAVRRARAGVPHTLRIEVEVETLEELREALDAGADAVLLDNADLETVKRAAQEVGGRVPLEVSGGVTLERVADLAGCGELLISVGRLTHSAPALDIALEVFPGR